MENRNYKDSVFVDLFAKDISAHKNFISLYNALHKKQLDPATTELEPIMLEKVLYMKYYNDIAMLVDNKIIIMIEHQSTINKNMPFRLLEYIARIYEKLVKTDEKFGRNIVKIPAPEFYVFYNGEEDYPNETILKLSDSFIPLEEKYGKIDFLLEITVKVVNINIDKHNPILKRCKVLEEYSEFVDVVRKHIKTKVSSTLRHSVQECIKKGILSKYLARKATEVENMLLAEYDYDTDIRVQRAEAFEEGAEKKAVETAKRLLLMGLTVEQVSEGTELSIKTVENLLSEMNK